MGAAVPADKSRGGYVGTMLVACLLRAAVCVGHALFHGVSYVCTVTLYQVNGTRSGLFTPEAAFEAINKKLVGDLQPPCKSACSLVCEELHAILGEKGEKLNKYPRLRDEVERLCHNFVNECEATAKAQVDMVINFETAYINTSHPEFVSAAQNLKGAKRNDGV